MKFSFTKHFWLSSIEVTLESMGKGRNITIELPLVRDQYKVYPVELENADKSLSDLYSDCTEAKYSFKTYITCISNLSLSVNVSLAKLLDMELEWETGDSSAEADAKRRRIEQSASSSQVQEAGLGLEGYTDDLVLDPFSSGSGDEGSGEGLDLDFGQDFGIGLETATDPSALVQDLGSVGMEVIDMSYPVINFDEIIQEPFVFSKIIVDTLSKYMKKNISISQNHHLYLSTLRNYETAKTVKKMEEVLLSELTYALMGTTEGLNEDEKSIIKLCTRSSILNEIFRQEHVWGLGWRKYRGTSKYIQRIITVGSRPDLSESD